MIHMLRLAILIFLSGLLTACAAFERQIAKDLIPTHETVLNRCEIEGFDYPGLDAGLAQPQILKVLMIHGVGIHHPGYSRRLQQNIANNTGLDVRSRVAKNIHLLDPSDHHTPIGNLRITFWENRDGSKKMLFYELTWSPITTPDKQIIAFDTTEQYSKFRVPFNNMMKVFLDDTLPDPLVYLVDKNDLILNSSKQALCWMLKTNWKNIPDNRAEVCHQSLSQEIDGLADQNLLFVTHSLGSQILMDTIVSVADRVSEADRTKLTPVLQAGLQRLKNRELTLFMLANQLPILQIGRPLPRVHNQIDTYCSAGGAKYRQRIFKGLNIVAFSDPNDLLSYAIPQTFADKYIDSRICPLVTNVSVNVAPEIAAFGLGIVNPVEAHTAYDNNPKVINLMAHGTENFNHDKALDNQCHFVLMKKDRQIP